MFEDAAVDADGDKDLDDGADNVNSGGDADGEGEPLRVTHGVSIARVVACSRGALQRVYAGIEGLIEPDEVGFRRRGRGRRTIYIQYLGASGWSGGAIDDRIFTVFGPEGGAVKIDPLDPGKQEPQPEQADFATPAEFKDLCGNGREITSSPRTCAFSTHGWAGDY